MVEGNIDTSARFTFRKLMPTSRAFRRFIDVISNTNIRIQVFKIQNYTNHKLLNFTGILSRKTRHESYKWKHSTHYTDLCNKYTIYVSIYSSIWNRFKQTDINQWFLPEKCVVAVNRNILRRHATFSELVTTENQRHRNTGI